MKKIEYARSKLGQLAAKFLEEIETKRQKRFPCDVVVICFARVDDEDDIAIGVTSTVADETTKRLFQKLAHGTVVPEPRTPEN